VIKRALHFDRGKSQDGSSEAALKFRAIQVALIIFAPALLCSGRFKIPLPLDWSFLFLASFALVDVIAV